jgi:nicotinamidase-related amidase
MPGPEQLVEAYVTSETLDAKLAEWLAAVAPYQFRQVPPLEPSGSALLVVDMTRPFVEGAPPLSTPAAAAVLPRVGRLVDAFRRADRPVIWLAQGHHSVAHDRGALLEQWWPGAIPAGGAAAEMPAGLDVGAGEKVIVKRRYSGFHQTDLDLTLRCLGIGSVVVCGVLTNVCPFVTAMDAFMHGYRVYYPADATGAFNEPLHVTSLCTAAGWFAHVVATAQVRDWLAG